MPIGLLAPGLVDDPATKRSLVAHAGVRRIVDLWERLEVAAFGIGGPAWSAAALGPDIVDELDRDGAVGEVLVSPFDLDGRFVCDALRDRTIAFDARDLGPDPGPDRRRRRAGEGPADPRRAARRDADDLVTDQPTAEAVLALDDAEAARGRGRARDEPRDGGPRDRSRHDRGQGRAGRPRRAPARHRPGGLRHRRRPGAGRAEQDPEAWWGAIGAGRPRARPPRRRARSVAIGIDGHGPTLVAVDADGRATHPAIIWQDTRSTAEQAELAAATGLQGWSLAGLPAALWLERHRPAAAARDPLVPRDVGRRSRCG